MPWNSDLPQGKALGSVTCWVSLTWTLLLVSSHISMKSWWQLWPPALSILYPWSRFYSPIPGLSDSPTKQDPAIRLPGKYFTHSKDCCYSGFCLLWFWLSVVAYTERTNDHSAVEDRNSQLPWDFSVGTDKEVKLYSPRAAYQTDQTSLKTSLLMTDISCLLLKYHSGRTFLKFLLKSSLKHNSSKTMTEGVDWK